MTETMTLPAVGEAIAAVKVRRWLTRPGDVVAQGQPVARIMTHASPQTLRADRAGRIVRLWVREGETLAVGAPLLEVDPEAGEGVLPWNPSPSLLDTWLGRDADEVAEKWGPWIVAGVVGYGMGFVVLAVMALLVWLDGLA